MPQRASLASIFLQLAASLATIAAMPQFAYHIAAEDDEPYPPAAELPTVEADDAGQALEKMKRQLIAAESGLAAAWLRVVIATHPNGVVRQAMTQQVPLVPVANNN